MRSSNTVSVHALSAGYLTLPERFFVTPLENPATRRTVPSLSFLIQHKDERTGKVIRVVFDLGIRRKLEDYSKPIYKHAMTRQPLSGDPDTVQSLKEGNLTPKDIDFVIFSHLHWDHVGTPSDFPTSTYVVGPGALCLIEEGSSSACGSHNHFEQGMLDLTRTVELPSTKAPRTPPLHSKPVEYTPKTQALVDCLTKPWERKGYFKDVMDVFGDGSMYIVSAPGHLDGHINLLCRIGEGQHIYLAGDTCHDERLLSGEKRIATWLDPENANVTCCIHKDKAQAEKTILALQNTIEDPGDLGEVEVIFAHDGKWEKLAREHGWFFPGHL